MTDDGSLSANPANSDGLLAPLATLAGGGAPTRDDQGRFLTGNSGGGRRKGSRNRLTEVFMSAIADDFAEHGAEAIARVRSNDPVTYLRIIAAIVPPDLVLKRELEPAIDYAELTYEEAGKLADAERKRQMIKNAIEGV
jgi:hypothetical protein